MLLSAVVVNFNCGHSFGSLRIQLDSASQVTEISNHTVRHFRLPTYPSAVQHVQGIGLGIESGRLCTLQLRSHHSSFQLKVESIVIPDGTLSYESSPTIVNQLRSQLRTLQFADSTLDHTKIDLIIGAEYFHHCIAGQTTKIGTFGLQETEFGWTPIGPVEPSNRQTQKSHCFASSLQSIKTQLCNYFAVEDVVQREPNLDIWESCKRHFEETYYQQPDG